jgi:DNA primase
VVEGQNDVIRLDTLGFPAIALCSNKATETQIDKLASLREPPPNPA